MDREDWNRRYREKELVWSAGPNRFLVDEVAGLRPGRALDLGSGEGRNAIWLAERGWCVTAVDFAEAGLDKAHRIAADRGVELELIQADLRDYEAEPDSFDLVLALYLHLPWPDMTVVLENARGAVAPGGTFLLIGHDRSNLEQGIGGPQNPAVLYTADQVAALFPDFDIESSGTLLRPVDSDDGPAHAIDCIVRARLPLRL